MVSPASQQFGIFLNIEKGVGQNVLLTRWEVSRGGEVGSFLSVT